MKIHTYLNEILRYLAYMRSQVQLSSTLNFTDINKRAEDFYATLLNLTYGYELININIDEPNAAAIDLGDKVNRVAIQVTSTSSIEKIKKTHTTFLKKKLEKDYDRLFVFNITDKANHRTKTLGDEGTFQFDFEKDLFDVNDLLREIGKKDVEVIQRIRDFLEANVNINTSSKLSKEISTFLKLVEVLSDENQPLAGTGFKDEPDPEGKIEHRFSEHSFFLKNLYLDLYVEYGAILSDVLGSADLGHSKIRRLGIYLKSVSDNFLTKRSGNAKVALEDLVEHFTAILSKNIVEFDQGAIRFFLVDQLIKCNVFPNKETKQ